MAELTEIKGRYPICLKPHSAILVALFVLDDSKHSEHEPRLHALGISGSKRQLHITFTLRHAGEKIRVISARDMHKKERAIYEKAT